jgi:hypothetical protein
MSAPPEPVRRLPSTGVKVGRIPPCGVNVGRVPSHGDDVTNQPHAASSQAAHNTTPPANAGRLPPRGGRLPDFDSTHFRQSVSVSKPHQLFGEQLPRLLNELNEVLGA